MQLYKVNFRTQRGDAVETGSFLACAKTIEDANALIATSINLPLSLTSFDTARVKPQIYELSRSDFRLSDIAAFIGNGKSNEDVGAVHEVRASAKVYAYSESSAARRFASAIIENASAHKAELSRHINDFSFEIERADFRPRPSKIEEQSIYKEKRFFAGGAARPR